jgi:hypothetical protein
MKKTLLLIISAFFAISLIAQSVSDKTGIADLQKKPGFDSKGLLVTGQKLDSTIAELRNVSVWTFSNRKKYSYSTVGLTTTVIGSKNLFPKDVGHPWANNDKTETTVDGGGNTTSIVAYTWNSGTSQWVGSMKTEYTYSGGNLASNSTFTFNTGTVSWDGLFRTEYTYTGGNLTSNIGLVWDQTLPIPGWVNSTKTVNTYTGGILTSELSYDWDDIGSSWGIATGKTEFLYSGDNMASATTSVWDINTSAFVFSSKSEYSYTSGRKTGIIVSKWEASQWVNASKSEYTYDTDGRLIQSGSYGWNAIGSVWYGFLKTESSYGVLGVKSYTTTIGYSWDFIGSQWVNQSRTTYWYSDLATRIDKISEKVLNVYPNPVKEFIVFDLPEISESATVIIFDMQGKKVLEQQLSGNKQIVVNNLRKGIYGYKIISNGVTYSGKLLK